MLGSSSQPCKDAVTNTKLQMSQGTYIYIANIIAYTYVNYVDMHGTSEFNSIHASISET